MIHIEGLEEGLYVEDLVLALGIKVSPCQRPLMKEMVFVCPNCFTWQIRMHISYTGYSRDYICIVGKNAQRGKLIG